MAETNVHKTKAVGADRTTSTAGEWFLSFYMRCIQGDFKS